MLIRMLYTCLLDKHDVHKAAIERRAGVAPPAPIGTGICLCFTKRIRCRILGETASAGSRAKLGDAGIMRRARSRSERRERRTTARWLRSNGADDGIDCTCTKRFTGPTCTLTSRRDEKAQMWQLMQKRLVENEDL
jgi:hypothetical protein